MAERLDRNKVKKLMELTRSDNDAEALSAIRMVNKLLDAAGVGWGNFIPREGAKRAPDFIKKAPTMTIDDALALVQQHDPVSVAEMARTWRRRKHMAPSDQRRLFEMVSRIQDEGGGS